MLLTRWLTPTASQAGRSATLFELRSIELTAGLLVISDMQDLHYSHEQLEELCRRYHVRKLSVFGSTLRGEAKPESDLDLLVEFEPNAVIGYNYFTFQRELSELFRKQVDLNTAGFLSKHFRQQVIDHARPIYSREGSSIH